MTSRGREDNEVAKRGTWSRFGATFGSSETWIKNQNGITDWPGKGQGDCQPLSVWHYSIDGGIINMKPGQTQQSNIGWFVDYWSTAIATSGQPSYPFIDTYPAEKSSAQYAAAALARTNPNRPYVDVVQNVLELGDIPRILKVAGETLIEKLAENYLRYQFGIRPLVKDIARTINCADSIHKRLTQLEKIRTAGSYRKTVTLDVLRDERTTTGRVFESQGGVFFVGDVTTKSERILRGHVRWIPTVNFSKFSQEEMVSMAKRSVFGLEANFSGIWEGIPWSWLIDWYSNVGDLLMQTRNIVPVTPLSITLMRHTTSISNSPAMSDQYRYMTAATVKKEHKERYAGSATLDAQLPILSADQMGILASLLVMKHKYVSPR